MKHYEDFYEESQQYSTILKNYEENGTIFTDPNFHPSPQYDVKETIITFDDKTTIWERIDKYYSAPLFKKEAIHEDAIQQGQIGNCYFVASLSRISRQPNIVELLFDTRTRNTETNQNSEFIDTINLKCGAVVVYIFIFGRRTPILIDTLIPFKRGTRKPLFSHPTDIKYSPWFCLVEKAYAKANGSYSFIDGGSLPKAIYNLFGYYPCCKFINKILDKKKSSKDENFDENEYLFSLLMKWQYENAVFGADISPEQSRKNVTEDEVIDSGLVTKHVYLIIKVRREEGKNFICLKNPWGDHEWLGDWSDTSDLWTPSLKKSLGVHLKENGTFWMIDHDFFHFFSCIDIAKPINPEYHCKSVVTYLRPGDFDGFRIEEKESHLENHQTFAFKLKNVRIKTASNQNEDIETVDSVKVYIRIEKRSPLCYTLNDCKVPKYVLLLVYNNGQKVSSDQIERFGRQILSTKKEFLGQTIHVTRNEPFAIVLQRVDKVDYTEECYIQFICKYDFDLYDIDHPEKLAEEDEKVGIIFDNQSKRFKNISRKICVKNIDGKEINAFDDSYPEKFSFNNLVLYKDDCQLFDSDNDDDLSCQYYKLKMNEKEIQDLTVKNETLNQKICNDENEISSLQIQKEEIEKNLHQKCSEIESQNQQIQELKQEISGLNEKQIDFENNIKSQIQQIESLESQKNEIQNSLSEKEKEIETQKNQIQEIESKNENNEKEILNIKEYISSIEKEKSNLLSINDKLQNTIKNNEKEIENQKNEIQKLKNQNIKLSQENSSNKEFISSIKKEKSILESKNKELQSKLEILEKKVEEQKQQIENSVQEIKTRNQEQKIDDFNNSIQTLENKLKEKDRELEEIKILNQKESKTQTEQINNLKQKNEELIKAEQKFNQQKEEIQAKLTNSIKEIKKILEKQTKANKDQSNKITELQTKINNQAKKENEQTSKIIDLEKTVQSQNTKIDEYVKKDKNQTSRISELEKCLDKQSKEMNIQIKSICELRQNLEECTNFLERCGKCQYEKDEIEKKLKNLEKSFEFTKKKLDIQFKISAKQAEIIDQINLILEFDEKHQISDEKTEIFREKDSKQINLVDYLNKNIEEIKIIEKLKETLIKKNKQISNDKNSMIQLKSTLLNRINIEKKKNDFLYKQGCKMKSIIEKQKNIIHQKSSHINDLLNLYRNLSEKIKRSSNQNKQLNGDLNERFIFMPNDKNDVNETIYHST